MAIWPMETRLMNLKDPNYLLKVGTVAFNASDHYIFALYDL
jgi:hypothetical protein